MCITRFWLNLAVMTITLLASCSNDDTSDLQKFVDEQRARKNPHVDEPPKYEMAPPFYYGAEILRDPFTPFNEATPAGPGTDTDPLPVLGCPLKPDHNRVRVGLELLPLDSLRMVGTLKGPDNVLSALVITPEGTTQPVKPGNYMGLNYGQIISITEAGIELTELYPDGKGCFIERITSLASFENK